MSFQNLELISQTSNMTEYNTKTRILRDDLIKELKLDNKFYAILVNGQNMKVNTWIETNSKIVILPKIAGG